MTSETQSKELVPGVSIVLCCFNSALRLPETLRHLAAQKVPENIDWEIILVDNASTDDTEMVARSEWTKYPQQQQRLRILYEAKPGKNYAYKQAVLAARFSYILTCDDDNWLNPDYVATVFEVLQTDRLIGVLGGQSMITPQQPAWEGVDRYRAHYVDGPQQSNLQQNWLYGAGSACRTSVLRDLFLSGWQQITSGRKGKSLICGEDVEICFMFYLLGYKLAIDDRLVFRHFIPLSRQNEDYIIRMSFWQAYTHVLLNSYYSVIYKSDIRTIGKWYRSSILTVIKQALLLGYRQAKKRTMLLSINDKLNWYSSLGTLISLSRNRAKIRSQHDHVLRMIAYMTNKK